MKQLELNVGTALPSVTLKLPAAQWVALNDNGRDDLSNPLGGVCVLWVERGQCVEARVEESVARTIRGMCEAFGVDLTEAAA